MNPLYHEEWHVTGSCDALATSWYLLECNDKSRARLSAVSWRQHKQEVHAELQRHMLAVYKNISSWINVGLRPALKMEADFLLVVR